MIIGQNYADALTDVPTQMLIAPVLPTMVSDRAYAVGEQFIVNSVLYKITQAVSAADVPLVVDTNCEVSDSITQQIKNANLKKTTLTYTSPSALTTGAHGYIRYEHTSKVINDTTSVVSIAVSTPNTSAAKGTIIMPDGVYTESGKTVLYFMYYVPETQSLAITWNFDIWYYD